jgi:PqqD family protein of HPr-rel-A system
MDPALVRWRVPGAPLGWRHWDDASEWVVFNPASGDLHLVNEPSARVLEVIEREPSTVAELERRFAEQGGPGGEAIDGLLRVLDALGLAEPVIP